MPTPVNRKVKKSNSNEGESISELAHRHLMDESHTTTDEELKNAKLELTGTVEVDEQNLFEVDNTTLIPPLPGEVNPVDESDKEDNSSLPNPYTVLGS